MMPLGRRNSEAPFYSFLKEMKVGAVTVCLRQAAIALKPRITELCHSLCHDFLTYQQLRRSQQTAQLVTFGTFPAPQAE
jgi:hypothetical protein